MSRKKRDRICVVCGSPFTPRRAGVGKTCGASCLNAIRVRNSTGRKASEATKAAKSASTQKAWAAYDADERQRRSEAAARGARAKWADPEHRAKLSALSSERMRLRHQDPEFQMRRNARSSRVMRATWEVHRARFTEAAKLRYLEGVGIASAESERRKRIAAKWIMTMATREMHAQTDYDATYVRVQERLRLAMPYDGPQEDSYYKEYLAKLGKAVVNDPECRAIADAFMSEAITRWSAAWREHKRVSQ